jgi:hypothetical protein
MPVPADYTGDGRAEIAVFLPATGTCFVRGSAAVVWVGAGDVPVPGNYLGDARAETAVFRHLHRHVVCPRRQRHYLGRQRRRPLPWRTTSATATPTWRVFRPAT